MNQNSQSAHTASSKKNWQRFGWLCLFAAVLIALMIQFGPKAWQKWNIYQAEKTLSQTAGQIAHIAPEPFPPSSETPQIEPDTLTLTESFQKKMAMLSVENLPKEKILSVPFICQNPFQDEAGWKVHRNSCEEAALLQAVLYLSGETRTPTEADRDIRDMISWEERPENFGAHINLYGEDMRKFIIGYYQLSPDAVVHLKNLDAPTIKKVLALGYPVIMPIEGDLLHNPFYPEPGYHMLTAVGYTATQVVTNDVGTKRGEYYPYDWDRLLTANKAVGNDGFVVLSLSKNKR